MVSHHATGDSVVAQPCRMWVMCEVICKAETKIRYCCVDSNPVNLERVSRGRQPQRRFNSLDHRFRGCPIFQTWVAWLKKLSRQVQGNGRGRVTLPTASQLMHRSDEFRSWSLLQVTLEAFHAERRGDVRIRFGSHGTSRL